MRILFVLLTLLFTSITSNAQTCNSLFTWDDTDITIQFIDLSTSDTGDPIVSWFWNFDDNGATSTLQNPIHTFSDPSVYDVSLTITTQNGCTSTIVIEIETCVLAVNYNVGTCDANLEIPVDITISDIYDNAKDVDVILDGSSVPGSPFEIADDMPVILTVFVPGDGLEHTILIQSTDIPTCGKEIIFTVPDCNSNCFLSSLQTQYPQGATHIVDVDDDFFSPTSVGITLGDIVTFNWVGDGHSTTSDVTSGPDSWNSGVISAGSQFDVSIENPGTHGYYCIPHGGPGGSGMSGEILANCPTGNTVDIIISFNTTVADPAGYNIYYDGTLLSGSPFSYTGIGQQNQTVSVTGDGNIHTIFVEDVSDPTCTLSKDFASPDCGQGGGNPVCSLTMTIGAPSGCDANQDVTLDVTVTMSNGGTGCDMSIDGGPSTYYSYNGPTTVVTITLPGDGQAHTIDIVDEADANCTATASVTTPDCNLPCTITNLAAQEASGGGNTTIVEVQDFVFSPANVNVVSGDVIEWQWTGAVAHTATSDATSGPDSFDSGLLGSGSTFTSPVLSEGTHPYYCEPHGAPGGVGMAGTINVLPPCNANDEVIVNITFDITNNGVNGYEVLVDGSVVGTFPYAAGSAQSVSVNVIGDGQSHSIEVRDVDDNTCNATTSLVTSDCGAGPACSLTMTTGTPSGCDANQNVTVDVTVEMSNGGTGCDMSIDGGPSTYYSYNGPTTVVTITLPGDGQSHTIDIVDEADANCTATASVTTPDCNLPCSITNLAAQEASGGGNTTIVEVQDFVFLPANVNIVSGDVIEWQWTGAVAHTATSDATSGPDSFDSGLLGNGSTFKSPVLSEGTHPYYCEPHGAPGGVGMAGTINVLPPCNANDEVIVNITFDITNNGVNGYEVLVDGSVVGTFPYAAGSAQSVSVNVIGDGQSHSIEVRDVDDNTCNATTNLVTSDCGAGPACSLTMTTGTPSGCDANQDVTVDVTVEMSNGGTGFDLSVDNGASTFYSYAGPTTVVTVTLPGDGQSHAIDIVDDADSNCTATTSVTTPDCNLPCSITNLAAQEASGGGNTTIVEVQDFVFSPANVNIVSGDVIEWQWTGAVAHTATSDATSGPDSFDSGLLGNGSTFKSPVLSEGTHPYYCEPHGAPGGVGMAGTINVLPPCNANDEVIVNITFDITNNGVNGYEVLVDGSVVGTFPYAAISTQSVSVNVIGDGQTHSIEVRDVDDNTCNATTSLVTSDCGAGPACTMSISGEIGSACDDQDNFILDVSISSQNMSNDFEVFIDGNSQGIFAYTGNETSLQLSLFGDGAEHTIIIFDTDDSDCTDEFQIEFPDCSQACEIVSLDLIFGDNQTHVVEVKDFEFSPKDLSIALGDTVLFDWVGNVAHTATSNVPDQPNSFDSGLLDNGEQYEYIPVELGYVPYYCIPHGTPGGVGMAGSISVNSSCIGDSAIVQFSATYQGVSGDGFIIEIDGEPVSGNPYAYDPSGTISGDFVVIGDGDVHEIRFYDIDNQDCDLIQSFEAPLCQDSGCSVTIDDVSFAECDGSNVEMTVDISSNQSNESISIYLNGLLITSTPLLLDDNGQASFVTSITGSGTDVELEIVVESDPFCMANESISIPDCEVDCVLSELGVGGQVHIVEVEDYEFIPKHVDISLGDTVRFVWTGEIPHTTTSDATTGVDSWDSGLEGEGFVYDVVIQEAGVHPYYCTPHGGPGGIGMAGTITAQDSCDGDFYVLNYSFEVTAGSNFGYNQFLDGTKINDDPVPYDDPSGSNNGIVLIPGDGETHQFTIQDVETDFCAITVLVESGTCGVACKIIDLQISSGENIIHEIEVGDFYFKPNHIEVETGETVRFKWVDEVPHTSTSDALTGPDVWDSGLLSKGDSFEISLSTTGMHPYYCIPHGGPGGIGQSGVIEAFPTCRNGQEKWLVEFIADGGSESGYQIFIDGELYIDSLFQYNNPDGYNSIALFLEADAEDHTLTIVDSENMFCANNVQFQSGICTDTCDISSITYQFVKNKHVVDVLDFDFDPQSIEVESGDTILFDWIGEVAHTATSSDPNILDAFNSGLLGQGETYEIIPIEIGTLDYYCIPHGTPEGSGMAGTIEVVDQCADESVLALFTFSATKNSGTYNVYLNDNLMLAEQEYNSSFTNEFYLELPGDNTDIIIKILDTQDASCGEELEISPIDCNDPCFTLQPNFDFTIDYANLIVDFKDLSQGQPTSWLWDFDGEGTSTEQNPSFTFSQDTVFEVCLTVTRDSCEATYCNKILFLDNQCEASFEYDASSLDVVFYNTSVNSDEVEYFWDFGDGNASTLPDSIVYTFEPGVYEVCLEIIGDSCISAYCEILDLTDPCLQLQPSFTFAKDNENDLIINFFNQTQGNSDTWLWGFGDGSTSTEENPTHEYDEMGVYNVCLFAQDIDNDCNESYCMSIEVGTVHTTQVEVYNQLVVYPNPSGLYEGVRINGFVPNDIGKEAKIKWFTSNGKEVESMSLKLDNDMFVKTPHSKGVFFITIQTVNSSYAAMVIKS